MSILLTDLLVSDDVVRDPLLDDVEMRVKKTGVDSEGSHAPHHSAGDVQLLLLHISLGSEQTQMILLHTNQIPLLLVLGLGS